MENILKAHEMMKDNPELQKKLFEETMGFLQRKEAENEKDALAMAVKKDLDLDLTQEELDTVFSKSKELSLEEIEKVSGGWDWEKFGMGAAQGGLIGMAAGGAIGFILSESVPGTLIGMGVGAAVGAVGMGVASALSD